MKKTNLNYAPSIHPNEKEYIGRTEKRINGMDDDVGDGIIGII